MKYNLTHPQKRIWYIEKMNPETSIHNVGGFMKIHTKIDVEKFRETFEFVVKNNDGMRLQFVEENGEPLQYVSEFRPLEIDYIDFSKYNEPEKEFYKWANENMKIGIDLINNRMFDCAIYKLNDEEYGFFIKMHHLIGDGWTTEVLADQTCKYYNALINGEEDVDIKFNSYIEYIEKEKEYLESSRFEKNKKYWNEKFLQLPAIKPTSDNDNLNSKRKKYSIDSSIAMKIKEKLKENKLSLNSFFIIVELLYLYKTKSENDFVLGIPVLNRSGRAQRNTVGMFTSTMPFRYKIEGNKKIKDMYSEVLDELKQCFLNQKYPYDLLVKDLEIRKHGYETLFDISVNYYIAQYNKKINGKLVEVEEVLPNERPYSFQIVVEENEEDINVYFDYKTSDYTDENIEYINEYMNKIIDEILLDDEQLVSSLSIITEKERKEKVISFNNTKSEYPRYSTVVDLFEEHVRNNPEKIAILSGDRKVTYKELDKYVNKLANYLNSKNVGKNKYVALMADHSVELVAMILATLKNGATYVPIDPNYPIERINYMINDSKATILYSDKELEGVSFDGEIMYSKDIELTNMDETFDNVSEVNGLAYILYTSGSTGKPKGVMVEHRGLTNYAYWAGENYMKKEDDIFAFYSSISFDLTVTSIFAPLVSGKTIDIYFDKDGEFVLYDVLERNRATVIKLTPSHLMLLKEKLDENSNIRRFILGGENLTTRLSLEVMEKLKGNVEIINEYGPTEAVVGCMIYRYNPDIDKSGSVPIGVPADNVEIYILDRDKNIIPYGGEGEIYIAGDGVTRGYLNKPELTEKSFIEIESDVFGKKIFYKTGDLAKYLPNGNIEFIGRVDNQLKIRGHRIELGEIENSISEYSAVNETVVIDKIDKYDNKVLCAYIIPNGSLDIDDLKEYLRNKLPVYMLPTYYEEIIEIPLNANGKIDYGKLPEIEFVKEEYVECNTEVEELLIETAKDVLGVDQISMMDKFFQLGGDSIKAIQIATRLREEGFELKIKDIMERETFADISKMIRIDEKINTAEQGVLEGDIRKTPIIEWFFNQQFSNENHYNQSVSIEFTKEIPKEKIEQALQSIITHHDMLRANVNEEANLYYNNKLLEEKYNVECFDISSLQDSEKYKKLSEIGETLKSGIDIHSDCLLQGNLVKLDENREILILTVHHLAMDGISWRILLEDFGKLLENPDYLQQQSKTHSFKKWAEELVAYRENILKDELEKWIEIEESIHEYPADFIESHDSYGSSASIERTMKIEDIKEISNNVNEVYSMKLNETLITALIFAINEAKGIEDITIELEGHGRNDIFDNIDISRTIGWFTTMYPMNYKVSSSELKANMRELKEVQRKISNAGFNYSIVKYLGNELSKKTNKLVRFNYLGDFDNIIDSEIFKIVNLDTGEEVCKNNQMTSLIDINAMILNNEFKIEFTFSQNRFKRETIEQLADLFLDNLNKINEHCLGKDDIELTPSDFDDLDMSVEDFDLLFE